MNLKSALFAVAAFTAAPFAASATTVGVFDIESLGVFGTGVVDSDGDMAEMVLFNGGSRSQELEFVNHTGHIIRVTGTGGGSFGSESEVTDTNAGIFAMSGMTPTEHYVTNAATPPSGTVGLGKVSHIGLGESLFLSFVDTDLTTTDFAALTYTLEVSKIPLPAAGWMLLSAVAGVGFLSRKRRNVA